MLYHLQNIIIGLSYHMIYFKESYVLLIFISEKVVHPRVRHVCHVFFRVLISHEGSFGLLLLGFNWTSPPPPPPPPRVQLDPPPPPPIYIITALTKQNKNLQEKSFITYQK